MADLTLRKNPAAFRFEAHEGVELVSQIDYYVVGDVVRITHTSTVPKYRGRGLAGRLTAFALDEIGAAGQKVAPLCSFTASFIADHPEYAGLVRSRG